MEEKIIYKVTASTMYVGSESSTEIEVYKEDLDHLPEDEWDDYVWEELGGKEAFHGLANGCIERITND